MRNRALVNIGIVIVIILLVACGSDSLDISGVNPISAVEKHQAKQFWHSQLLNTMLTKGIQEQDINRHLYLLEALIRQVEVYDKSALVGADLTSRAIQMESSDIGFSLPDKSFIDGQAYFIQNVPDKAIVLLEKYLDQTNGASTTLQNTASMYLRALNAGERFERLFLTPEGGLKELLPGCLDGNALSISELLATDFDVYDSRKYDCGLVEPCLWEIADLSVFPYLKARVLTESIFYTQITFQNIKPQEYLFYELLASIAHSIRTQDNSRLVENLHTIKSKGLEKKNPFATYYQLSRSFETSKPADFQNIAKTEPLTLFRILNSYDDFNLDDKQIEVIYKTALPTLFDGSLSTQYRDYVYVELWKYLWNHDLALLEKFRLSKGYSPGVIAPDFFLDLLPYRVSHSKENGLGNKDLKTQVQHHPYLRPLIKSYEYIAVKSMSDNAGKTGVG